MTETFRVYTNIEKRAVQEYREYLEELREGLANHIYHTMKDRYDHPWRWHNKIGITYDELMEELDMENDTKIDFSNFIGTRGIWDTLNRIAAQDKLEVVKGKELYDFRDFVCVDNPNIHKQVALHSRTTLYLRRIKK